jgi:trehalose/maltose transport system substrate-binding protein
MSIGTVSAKQAASPALATSCATHTPIPKVANAAAIKKAYKGQSIVYEGDSNVGCGHFFDSKLVAEFTKATGIKIKIIQQSPTSDVVYQKLARLFSAKSSSIDVMMLDVVWPGQFAPYLANVKKGLGSQVKQYFASAVAADTINGKMVAAPYFGDEGILYYRTDLLKKYGYSHPPTTWQQLTSMATKIQAGERKTIKNFYGFTFQGSAYEGLTCDALEWLSSTGGGQFFSGKKSNVNNPAAVKILNLAKSWVGTIAPEGVTTYTEENARIPFDDGLVAFMRNWPYAYADSIDKTQSKIVGKFSVAPLPHNPGLPSRGTLGGWQLGVNKFSKHQGAATAFVKYMTGPGVSKYRAINGAYLPLIVSVAHDKQVIKSNPPFAVTGKETPVVRPSKFLGTNYARGSQYIFQDINQILRGTDASSILPTLQQQLDSLVK